MPGCPRGWPLVWPPDAEYRLIKIIGVEDRRFMVVDKRLLRLWKSRPLAPRNADAADRALAPAVLRDSCKLRHAFLSLPQFRNSFQRSRESAATLSCGT